MESEKLNSQLQNEAIAIKRAFSKVRINLDSELREWDKEGIFNSPFMSVWVSGWSSASFQAKLKPNYKNDTGTGIDLKPNMALNFDKFMAGFKVYSESDQAGAWIELTIGHYSAIDSGSIEVDVSGKTQITEGSNFTDGKSDTITTTPVLVLASSSDRTVTTVFNKSGVELWYGSNANLSDADFKNLCPSLADGEALVWKNSSGLYFRKDTGEAATPTVIVLEEEI